MTHLEASTMDGELLLAPGAFDILGRKVARLRRRRENVPCGPCIQLPASEGHDACLGTLPGVKCATRLSQRVPVVREGRLVGIIARVDLRRALVRSIRGRSATIAHCRA
jgi:CBS domain-containing protein